MGKREFLQDFKAFAMRGNVIDMGPEGGNGGGHIVCAGTPEDIAACPDSYTGRFLKEKLK